MSDFSAEAKSFSSQETSLNGEHSPIPPIKLEGILADKLDTKEDMSYNSPEAKSRAQKLDLVLSEMDKLPLWVKQVIYTDLKSCLEKDAGIHRLPAVTREDFLQLWKPVLTERGQEALRHPCLDRQGDMTLLLEAIHHADNVAMMCARYEWSLQNACHLLISALRQHYISLPTSKILEASIRFLGDDIRLGEYLVFIGRVDHAQMELALQTQQYIESALGDRAKIADILIRLELLTPEDVDSILFLKAESLKPFRLF